VRVGGLRVQPFAPKATKDRPAQLASHRQPVQPRAPTARAVPVADRNLAIQMGHDVIHEVGRTERSVMQQFVIPYYCSTSTLRSPYMIGANGSVRGKKEFEPSSLAAESEPLLGPHLEDY
jgi:hypothetical protein